MTNADRIRQMSDEELIEILIDNQFDCSLNCKDFGMGCKIDCKFNKGKDFALKWLQAESEGK